MYDEANNMVILEWKSTPTADAYADSVLAMVIRVDTEAKVTAKVRKISMNIKLLYSFFSHKSFIRTEGKSSCKRSSKRSSGAFQNYLPKFTIAISLALIVSRESIILF